MAIPSLPSAAGAPAAPPLAIHHATTAAHNDAECKERAGAPDYPSEALIRCGRWLTKEDVVQATAATTHRTFNKHLEKLQALANLSFDVIEGRETAVICGIGYSDPLLEIATVFSKVILIGLDRLNMEEMIEKLPSELRPRCEVRIIDLSGSITAIAEFTATVEKDFNTKLKALADPKTDTDKGRLKLYEDKEEAISKFLDSHQPAITALLPPVDFMLVRSMHNLVAGTIDHILESTITTSAETNLEKRETNKAKRHLFFLKAVDHAFNFLSKTIRRGGAVCEVDVVLISQETTPKLSKRALETYFKPTMCIDEWSISDAEVMKVDVMIPPA